MHGILGVIAIAILAAPVGQESGWVSLFDGGTLGGWVQKNGTATYGVKDGAIVGRSSTGEHNSFLCTARGYGNFELEFEVRLAKGLNSGVQVRSREKASGDIGVDPKAPLGRVHGPQVEIDAGDADGSNSGYVYGEATGRGWITPEDRLRRHRHFKDGEWNRFRIVAEGSRFRTWINGQAVEDLTDAAIFETHPRGFIGLQVHAVKSGQGPFEVAWRNIRIREIR
jgi:hypothetical protein